MSIKLIKVGDDGSFRLNMDYFSFHYSTKSTYNQKFVDLFGAPRRPESEFYTTVTHPKKDHPQWSDQIAAQNQHYADVAASIQTVTEEIMLKMARHAHAVTGSKNLVIAGGVALNSVANGRIIKETPFEDVFIQPAAGDSGGALGAALYAYHVLLNNPREFVMEHAYWGQEYSEAEMKAAIEARGFPYERIDDDEKLLDQVVDRLTQQQSGELVPRALRMGPAGVGAPIDSGRSPLDRDEGSGQPQDQIPRAVPPFCAGGPGRARARILRDAVAGKILSGALHAAGRAHSRSQAR